LELHYSDYKVSIHGKMIKQRTSLYRVGKLQSLKNYRVEKTQRKNTIFSGTLLNFQRRIPHFNFTRKNPNSA